MNNSFSFLKSLIFPLPLAWAVVRNQFSRMFGNSDTLYIIISDGRISACFNKTYFYKKNQSLTDCINDEEYDFKNIIDIVLEEADIKGLQLQAVDVYIIVQDSRSVFAANSLSHNEFSRSNFGQLMPLNDYFCNALSIPKNKVDEQFKNDNYFCAFPSYCGIRSGKSDVNVKVVNSNNELPAIVYTLNKKLVDRLVKAFEKAGFNVRMIIPQQLVVSYFLSTVFQESSSSSPGMCILHVGKETSVSTIIANDHFSRGGIRYIDHRNSGYGSEYHVWADKENDDFISSQVTSMTQPLSKTAQHWWFLIWTNDNFEMDEDIIDEYNNKLAHGEALAINSRQMDQIFADNNYTRITDYFSNASTSHLDLFLFAWFRGNIEHIQNLNVKKDDEDEEYYQ